MSTYPDNALKLPSGAACETVLDTLGDLPLAFPHWQPQQAPGSLLAAAEDSRRLATLFEGWSKLSVPFRHDNPEGQVTVPAGTAGRTFELAIDWKALGHECPPAELAARLSLVRDDATVLCVPATGARDGEALTLRFERSRAASFFGKKL